jgi:hypothetical protein
VGGIGNNIVSNASNHDLPIENSVKPEPKPPEPKQQSALINIETFKKLCGNRTANYFLISNNNTIPKSSIQKSP